jgi:hypothetical protein
VLFGGPGGLHAGRQYRAKRPRRGARYGRRLEVRGNVLVVGDAVVRVQRRTRLRAPT